MYCNDADGLFGAVSRVLNAEEWRRFVDLLKVSLKTVRLHSGKIYPPISLTYSVYVKEFHGIMCTLLNYIAYDECSWNVYGDLKVL